MRDYKVWLDRALSLATVLVAVAALYLLTTERLLPALRGAPVRLGVGGQLAAALEFRSLPEGDVGAGASRDVAVPGERPTLLFVYNSTCPACYVNVSAWQEVMEAAGGRATVLAVALERERSAAHGYARQHLPAATAVVPKDPREFAGTLGVEVVPFTALVSRDGVLEFVRPGSLDSLAVRSLLRALEALAVSLNS